MYMLMLWPFEVMRAWKSSLPNKLLMSALAAADTRRAPSQTPCPLYAVGRIGRRLYGPTGIFSLLVSEICLF